MKLNFFTSSCMVLALATGMSSCTDKGSKFSGGINLADMDTSINPAENFYLYANGGWLKNNPIPSTESRWGTLYELQENNYAALRNVLEAAAKANADKGTNTQKVGDFYKTGMDSAAIEKAGISPLTPEFDKINAIKNTQELLAEVARLQSTGTSAMFTFYAYQDPKNSSAVVPQAYQGGLGLPDRDYYINNDERSSNIRKEYLIHMTNMFKLMGDDEAKAKTSADAILKLETSLAKASMTRVEQRDPNATYHKMTIAELNKLTPSMDWAILMDQMGVKQPEYLVIGQPVFFKELSAQLKSTSLDIWKTYLRWRLVRSYASQLSTAFVNENFRFNGTILNGTKELKPRWKRVLQEIDGNIGEALGEEYVKTNFKPEAKQRVLDMVNNMQKVFENRIKNLDWMAPETKEKAITKLNGFIKKIGFPDKWKDYSKVEISDDSYVMNVMRCNEFAYNEMIAKIGKPVDKTEWGMTPPTVNAYYNPSINEIVFPAGILQSPFFDPNADDAVNYGAIGAVIGHEMTHGFDDEGRQFDAEGNLKDWWTKDDAAKFIKKADVVVNQFNSYTVLDSVHVNGQLTLGENLADLGGLSIAYEAFKNTEQGKSGEKIDGLSPDQRFFIGWAQGWRNNSRDEVIAQRIVTDPHSPGLYRTNGPVSNMPEFYSAFNVKEGDAMHRADSIRAKIW